MKQMMSEDRFHDRYRIPSARAQWHNYDGGEYFVTVCTRNREHYFGEIADGEMHLSGMGQYAHEQMRDVTIHYPYAEIPFWVVMPNHIHAIVIIDGDNIPTERRNIKKWRDNMETCHTKTGMCRVNMEPCRTNVETRRTNVETRRATSLQTWQRPDGDEMKRNTAFMQGWLSVVVGGIKSAITKFSRQNGIPFAWQARFHDHIIRNQDEMDRIVRYIGNNVAKWESDELNR